jgi:hypothetical protein
MQGIQDLLHQLDSKNADYLRRIQSLMQERSYDPQFFLRHVFDQFL